MTSLRGLLAVTLVLALSGTPGLGTARVAAVDPPGQPEGPSTQVETIFAGVPSYNVMKTEDSALGLSTTLVNAFAPITLPCPSTAGANGCTFRVVVSSQFWDIPATATGQMQLTISGAGALGPAGLVNVASDTSPSLAETHTMQWVKRNVPAGTSVTVTMQFKVNTGTAFGGYRTMSIDVFNGLI